jgi:DNA-binding protein Fis
VATPPVAPTVAEAGGDLTLSGAFDFIYTQLAGAEEPMMPRVERELFSRVVASESGDETKAAKRLGVAKAALQKRLKE